MDTTKKSIKNGHWTSNLCDCCDDPLSCLEAWCCSYCQVSAQRGMLSKGRVGVEPLYCFGMCCLDVCLLMGVALCVVSCSNRGDIRRRYGIEGSDCEDCLLSCFCTACAVSQQYRELCYRGTWPGGVCVSPPNGAPHHHAPMGQPQPNANAPVAGEPVYGYPQQTYGNTYPTGKEQPSKV